MKIGSLFDGSGGFPLAGMINGFTPTWASEVEPYPIAVTRERIQGMKHLGSVTEINGAEIEPVDVITFGSPCQDLSVAGKQKGIHEGVRSSLFFEAIRIIKEMRAHDRAAGRTGEHVRPRFAVWENMPGAYSSNGGRDFQAVLQAFCDIGRPGDTVSFPQKWGNAGCIVGEGYSIAWRTYDAQYWHGTPQRRKRIYLIADFASERAGEILFEQESMPRDIEPGGKEGQGTAADAERSAGGSDCVGWDPYNGQLTGEVCSTLGTNCGMPTGRSGVIEKSAGFVGRQGAKSGSVGYEDEKSPTLRQGITTDCVYAIEGKCIDRNSAQNGKGWSEDKTPTINATDRHAVCYGIEGDGNVRAHIGDNISPCMKTIHPNCVCYDTTQITSPANYSNPKIGDPCHPLASNQHPPLVQCEYPRVSGALCANSHPGSYTGQDAYNDMLPVFKSDKPPRKWIVRRLTPLECCRLQGFPDGWGDVLEITDLTDNDYAFWLSVRNTHAAINGKKQGKYTKEQMIRWLNALHTDSAEYKMWGNGIALPCARDVMRRIAKAIGKDMSATGMEAK